MLARMVAHPTSLRADVSKFIVTAFSKIGLILLVYTWLMSWCFATTVQATELHGGPFGERSLDANANKVTVTVLDLIPPSPPILISPTNNSYVLTSYPTFVWYGSTDNNPMDHYQLWVDGKLFVNLIPLVSYENSLYKLTYNKATNQYSLTVKKSLADGVHTWKVLAFDMSLNSNSSATWSFTIDTQAPNFIINRIGRLPVTISAYDISTIPNQPITLDLLNNEPLLQGTGEPHSTIVLTLTIPGSEGRTYSTTIDKYGKWSIQLGILPRDVIISLSFVIEDQAGLLTVLDGVRLIIPTNLAGGGSIKNPTPTPAQSGTTEPVVTLDNFWPFADWHPVFTKQLAPIKAFVYSLFEQALQALPPAIAIPLSQIPTQPTGPMAWLLIWLNWFIALTVPTLLVTAVIIHTRFQVTIAGLLQILKACHLWPLTTGVWPEKPGGWVLDPQTNKGVAFAKVRLLSLEKNQEVDCVFTDEQGFFPQFEYLINQHSSDTYTHYRLLVERGGQTYDFAVLQSTWPVKTMPSFIYLHNTYQGGVVSFNHQKPAPFWIIPIQDPQEDSLDLAILSSANLLPSWLLILYITLTFLVLVFYTTLPNTVVVLYYILLAGMRVGRALQTKNVSIYLTDDQKQPVAAGLVLCRPIYDPTTLWVGHTDKHGYARFRLTDPAILRKSHKDRHYLVSCFHHGLYPAHKTHLLGASKLIVGQSPAAQQFSLTSTSPTTSCCRI